MPSQLKYLVDDPNRHVMPAFRFSLQIALYQEYLLNDFLLDRLPDSGSVKTKQTLLETAQKMLDGVLVLCANRDKLTNYTTGFVWAVSYPFNKKES